MFDEIKEFLKTTKLQSTGEGGGGCINEGEVYETDNGKVFIKRNSKKEARKMFEGEFASLEAIKSTGAIKCPQPFVVVDNPTGGAVLVMEFVDMKGFQRKSELLGEQLAKMHLYNIERETKTLKANSFVGGPNNPNIPQFIDKFGFDVETCCGFIPQSNTWHEDWVVYYGRKLEEQIDLLSDIGDRELSLLWSELRLKLPQFFCDIEVKPSLLHGDLWSGNAAETSSGPVIFDPASFYGHHEYDLGIMAMFGGFDSTFWSKYHKIIPKAKGYEKRLHLYELFHNLNHWNHFGSSYRNGSLRIMSNLVKH